MYKMLLFYKEEGRWWPGSITNSESNTSHLVKAFLTNDEIVIYDPKYLRPVTGMSTARLVSRDHELIISSQISDDEIVDELDRQRLSKKFLIHLQVRSTQRQIRKFLLITEDFNNRTS